MVIPNIWIPQKLYLLLTLVKAMDPVRTETSERPVVNSPLIKLDVKTLLIFNKNITSWWLNQPI